MNQFVITSDAEILRTLADTVIRLNPLVAAEGQMARRFLPEDVDSEYVGENFIKDTFNYNLATVVEFGWSFESINIYESMMRDCLTQLGSGPGCLSGNMTSSYSCDWLGFQLATDHLAYVADHMCLDQLITLNNSMCRYQIQVVEFMLKHDSFLSHAFLRDHMYRFDYMKSIRRDKTRLGNAFHYYIDSFEQTTGYTTVPRFMIESEIGCHYLKHPEVFLELLNFYIIKGTILDE